MAKSHWPSLMCVSPRESNPAARFGSSRIASLQSVSAPCNSPVTARTQQRSFPTPPTSGASFSAAIVERFGITRVEFDRFRIIANGELVFTGGGESVAAIVESHRQDLRVL